MLKLTVGYWRFGLPVKMSEKDKGVMIALEYVGPANFQWSDNDVEIDNCKEEVWLNG